MIVDDTGRLWVTDWGHPGFFYPAYMAYERTCAAAWWARLRWSFLRWIANGFGRLWRKGPFGLDTTCSRSCRFALFDSKSPYANVPQRFKIETPASLSCHPLP
ncbi:hypothetical protein BDN70DRAFT_973928 [Pholiota conissans]|uniref:Uncharacterized protein n=1 Tax=Pholiota conissans TaxID=109636 RepID=A0A9P5Z781_9AGAR|nr:hypothetical protein BDN70DRAFT_973928 [Pholiota conissans]